MPGIFVTAEQLEADPEAALRAAESGAVVITENGDPAHVLISFAAYRLLTGAQVAAPSEADERRTGDIA